jgi:phospholipase/carboxylesterase
LIGLKLGVGAIVSFSGLYLDDDPKISSRDTKILMVHGAEDTVSPISDMQHAKNLLKRSGADVQLVVRENMGHCIDDIALQESIDFIQEAFHHL